ncbi:response regulator [Streptomyces sp. NPDC051940]|uniref:DNA-binding response regulator n=1 Tax=Streptomyces sp. NPDC051940 TaxID=3155675 RepID=UPI00342C8EAA
MTISLALRGDRAVRPVPVTAVVIDDQPAVIAGVRAWCIRAGISVVASGAEPRVAFAGAGREAQVVVCDLQRGLAGPAFAELRRLVDDGRRVIVYTTLDARECAHTCLDIGAFAYVPKAEGRARLVAAIQAAAADLPYTPPTFARPRLSVRETDVLIEWFLCGSKQMVADRLGLSVRTVNGYIERIRIKYANVGRQAPTKAALIIRALQDDLVRIDDL